MAELGGYLGSPLRAPGLLHSAGHDDIGEIRDRTRKEVFVKFSCLWECSTGAVMLKMSSRKVDWIPKR